MGLTQTCSVYKIPYTITDEELSEIMSQLPDPRLYKVLVKNLVWLSVQSVCLRMEAAIKVAQ